MSDAQPDPPPADEPPPAAETIDAEVLDAEVTDAQVTDADVIDAAGAPVPLEPTGYTAGGVPTFDAVREKIETRFGTALGAAELASETPEGRSVEEQFEARQKAAADRLAEIRASMKRPDDH